MLVSSLEESLLWLVSNQRSNMMGLNKETIELLPDVKLENSIQLFWEADRYLM